MELVGDPSEFGRSSRKSRLNSSRLRPGLFLQAQREIERQLADIELGVTRIPFHGFCSKHGVIKFYRPLHILNIQCHVNLCQKFSPLSLLNVILPSVDRTESVSGQAFH